MAKNKKPRDKKVEKAVKERLGKTHLKSIKILGSTVENNVATVYLLRMVDADNYLFKVNCVSNGDGTYMMSGLIPMNEADEIGEYRVYNPKTATADALKPTKSEKKFKGYN